MRRPAFGTCLCHAWGRMHTWATVVAAVSWLPLGACGGLTTFEHYPADGSIGSVGGANTGGSPSMGGAAAGGAGVGGTGASGGVLGGSGGQAGGVDAAIDADAGPAADGGIHDAQPDEPDSSVVLCGGEPCLAIPFFVELPGCCLSDDRCGADPTPIANYFPKDLCVPRDHPGKISPQCKPAPIATSWGGIYNLPGCCTPEGSCGALMAAAGLGCVAREALGFQKQTCNP